MTQDYINKIIQGDCIEVLRLLDDKSVHCCVTSPPYYALRDYGVDGQIGLEKTPEAFIQRLVEVFREVKRVLRDDGTLWVNIGDSYASTPTGNSTIKSTLQGGLATQIEGGKRPDKTHFAGIKPKDLIGIPWMLAFALRADGWYLRMDIIWSKPNPMPESVTDRPTKAHEYIFLLSKSGQYYYDATAIKTEALYPGISGMDATGFKDAKKFNGKHSTDKQRGHSRRHAGFNERWDNMTTAEQCSMGANKRSVWTVPTKPFAEAHFATFPENLIIDCIKAGTSEYGCCPTCGEPFTRQSTKELVPGPKASFNSKADERDFDADIQDQGSNRMKDGHKPGWMNKVTTTGWDKSCDCERLKPAAGSVVLDMFFGAGTTGLVARKLNRNYIGCELNPAYIAIAEKRIAKEIGLFQ